MPLGDSLTGFPDSYRGPLYRTLKDRGYNVDFVGSIKWPPTGGGDADSNGWGGFTIGPDDRRNAEGMATNLAANLETWFQKTPADVILLVIGANDFAAGDNWITQAPGKYENLIRRIVSLAPNATLLIGDVPPSGNNPNGFKELFTFNAVGERAGSASETDNVLHVPIWARLNQGWDTGRDTLDGGHFSAVGGVRFANAWLPELIPVLNQRACR